MGAEEVFLGADKVSSGCWNDLEKVADIIANKAERDLAEARNNIYRYMIDQLSLNLEAMNGFLDKDTHKKFCNEKCLFKSMNLEKCKDGEEQCDIGAVLEELAEKVVQKQGEAFKDKDEKGE